MDWEGFHFGGMQYLCNNSGSWEGEGECNRSIHLSAFRGMIKSILRWPTPLGVTSLGNTAEIN